MTRSLFAWKWTYWLLIKNLEINGFYSSCSLLFLRYSVLQMGRNQPTFVITRVVHCKQHCARRGNGSKNHEVNQRLFSSEPRADNLSNQNKTQTIKWTNQTRSNYTWLTESAGKRVRASHDWFWFEFWLDEKVGRVFRPFDENRSNEEINSF